MQKSQIFSKETEALEQRLEEQRQTIDKLKKQEAKLDQYVKEFKTALKKKQEKELNEANKKNQQEEDRIQKQLEKQVENAKTMLKNYQHELRNLQKKALKNTYTPDDLMKVEEELKLKQIELKQVQEEIKDLKIVKRKQQKLIEKKQKNQENDGVKLSKLVEEVRKQKQILQQLKNKTTKQQEQLNKKMTDISAIEAKYKQKCKEAGQTPLTFEEFKEKRKEKKRQESSSKPKEKVTKKIVTVKQMINNQYQVENFEPTQKNLKELKLKKQVAETSLKLAQKKDEKQIEELKAKLEKLKEENKMMQEKLAVKTRQKEQLDKTPGQMNVSVSESNAKVGAKFSVSRNSVNKGPTSLSRINNPGSNTTTKLEPINK